MKNKEIKEKNKDLLKKSSVKVPSISNKQLIKNLAGSNYTMFKSEPKSYSNPVQDNRSIFFRAEVNREMRKL